MHCMYVPYCSNKDAEDNVHILLALCQYLYLNNTCIYSTCIRVYHNFAFRLLFPSLSLSLSFGLLSISLSSLSLLFSPSLFLTCSFFHHYPYPPPPPPLSFSLSLSLSPSLPPSTLPSLSTPPPLSSFPLSLSLSLSQLVFRPHQACRCREEAPTSGQSDGNVPHP